MFLFADTPRATACGKRGFRIAIHGIAHPQSACGRRYARKGTEKGCVDNAYRLVLCLVGGCVCEGCRVRAPGPGGLCALRARTLPCAGSGWVLLILALPLTLRARDAAQVAYQSPSA